MIVGLTPQGAVIHLRYGGMAYREIAAKLGVCTAAVEVRHKRMIESIPVLRELFPGKARKRAAKRRAGGREWESDR